MDAKLHSTIVGVGQWLEKPSPRAITPTPRQVSHKHLVVSGTINGVFTDDLRTGETEELEDLISGV